MCTQSTSTVKTFSVILAIINFHAYEAVRFIYQPKERSAAEGRQVHITCIFTDISDEMKKSYDIIWTKESNIISDPSNEFDLDRFTFHNIYADYRHFLKINPIKREDGGKYRCHFHYGGEILLTSNFITLTIREIPSKKYPLIVFGKPTYKTGDKITIKCFCEKTTPLVRLEWLRSSKDEVIGVTTNTGANNTHVWIEATVPATLELNDVFFECRIKVRDEIPPRYSSSERLLIINGIGSEFFKTTTQKPSRQTQQQYVTHSLSTDTVLYASKAEDETFAEGITVKQSFGLGIVTGAVITLITLILFLAINKYWGKQKKL